MDIQTLYNLFQATFQPDPNVRIQAELQLKQLEGTQGALLASMQIIGSEDSVLHVRQAASIYFKNAVKRYWFETESTPAHLKISESDKDAIKGSILQLLASAPQIVRTQLLTVLGTILSNDFPAKYPGYLTQVQSLLQSQDPKIVFVGLLALKEVTRVYKFKVSDREPVDEIIATFFPAIQQIGTGLISANNVEAAEMLKIIFKCYHHTIQIDLSERLRDNASLVPWGTLFIQMVEKPVPTEGLPTDLEELEKHPWWKAKRWAYQCLNRLYTRYGNPTALTSESKFKPFANSFIVNFAPNILTAYLKQVELWVAKQAWLSPRVLCLMGNFFEESVKDKHIWSMMKPHSETLITHFVFPQLCFTSEDEALWVDDPVEYVHAKIDVLEDFTSPSTAATNFMTVMARYRQNAFMQILALANSVLQKYNESPAEAKNPREKDGALVMIGALAPLILRKKSLSSMMEPFFVNHVFPEFKSQYPFLRARACEMVNQFSDLDFEDSNNVAFAFTSLMESLRDSQLPVKVTAALALRPMIRHEAVCEAMKPHLQFIMHELLAMTNQIDVDTLSEVMDEFVEVFAQDLAPFAVQLCEQLRDTFLRICADMGPNADGVEALTDRAIDEASDKTMAAMGVLKTMGTLILSLESTPEVLNQLEIALLPVITFTLQNAIIDLFDGVFEIIDSCTFSAKAISANMWGVFELIYKTFKESALDFMEEMLPSLDNYISYGKDVFSTNENVQHTIYDIIESVMKSDRLGENDRVQACKLAESLMLNCRGHVDKYIAPILNLVFHYLAPEEGIQTIEFRVQALEVVMNALYYNAPVTLRLLEENGWTQRFLTVWFTNLDKFSRVHDKKLSIFALCSILNVPVAQLPPALQSGWPQILNGILTNFEGLPVAQAKRKEMEKMYNIGSDDDSDDDSDADSNADDDSDDDDEEGQTALEAALAGDDDVEEEWVDDEEDVYDEGHEYLEYLAQQASKTRAAKASGDDEEDEEEDDEEDFGDLEEEIYFESPLDDLDPYIVFREVFTGLQQHNPASYAELTKETTPEQQEYIIQLINVGEVNATAAAENAAAAAAEA
ncbi:MAG: armadillo-type protein [Linnemannia elongata]|nr:MAG: armadillo-type protein [Linnemannia elongata]